MLTLIQARSILTRCSGYLLGVTSHSLNPYVGCSLGRSLCGVACYAQHNRFLTKGRAWGSFLEGKANAAELYLREAPRRPFSVFMSSSTEPFPPQEKQAGISLGLLEAMLVKPPERLILQTHSALVADYVGILARLPCEVRVHISLESDRERLPGLPGAAYSVARRLEAARVLREAGLFTVACLSPLIPLEHPSEFFSQLQECFEAVVVDHFVGGSAFRGLIEAVQAGSSQLSYRDEVVALAQRFFPGRVGVGPEGFAGRYLTGSPELRTKPQK